MNGKIWIVIGFLGIAGGKLFLPLLGFGQLETARAGFPGMPPLGTLIYAGAAAETLFWGGLVAAAFGLVKYYKEE